MPATTLDRASATNFGCASIIPYLGYSSNLYSRASIYRVNKQSIHNPTEMKLSLVPR
jgi:hypothetical protein